MGDDLGRARLGRMGAVVGSSRLAAGGGRRAAGGGRRAAASAEWVLT
ncbi:hypothetical protein [Streptomyces sp. NPDC059262]